MHYVEGVMKTVRDGIGPDLILIQNVPSYAPPNPSDPLVSLKTSVKVV